MQVLIHHHSEYSVRQARAQQLMESGCAATCIRDEKKAYSSSSATDAKGTNH